MASHLDIVFKHLGREAVVLDVGCMGFGQVKLFAQRGMDDARHFGVDYSEPESDMPKGFQFRRVNLNVEPLPFDDDFFDYVVASHVIEHVKEPLVLIAECIRVCKPSGFLYLEAPSERSLLLPGMPFEHNKFFSLSFFDDPTHQSRPWTPQALTRAAAYFSCEALSADYLYSWKYRLLFPFLITYALATRSARRLERYCWQAIGWACFVIIRKPAGMRGEPSFRYFIPEDRT